MALDRQRQVGAGHALAVVGHANEPPAAAVGEHVDARGAGIERVLDELLDHACRALDHLAGGDAVDDGFGELADGHGRLAQAAPTLAAAALRREGLDQSNDGLARRSCLSPARCFLPSMRRSREARVGRVGRRGRGGIAARRMRSMRRSSASCRLRAWVRWRCAMMTRTPSRVSRAPASRSSRARTSSRERRRSPHVEAKLHRGRKLVDVLAARPRGAHEAFLDLALVDVDMGGDADHGGLEQRRSLSSRGPFHFAGAEKSTLVETIPSGRPTTVTRSPPSRRRLATRLASSSVTASINCDRRVM